MRGEENSGFWWILARMFPQCFPGDFVSGETKSVIIIKIGKYDKYKYSF